MGKPPQGVPAAPTFCALLRCDDGGEFPLFLLRALRVVAVRSPEWLRLTFNPRTSGERDVTAERKLCPPTEDMEGSASALPKSLSLQSKYESSTASLRLRMTGFGGMRNLVSKRKLVSP